MCSGGAFLDVGVAHDDLGEDALALVPAFA